MELMLEIFYWYYVLGAVLFLFMIVNYVAVRQRIQGWTELPPMTRYTLMIVAGVVVPLMVPIILLNSIIRK